MLGTVGGLTLLLRLDPETGAGLRPAASAAQQATGASATLAMSTSAGQQTGTAVLGKLVTTDFGHIQVQIRVSGRRIVGASTVRVPEDGGTQGKRINGRALPILATQTLAAQNAKIDGVSGATISSNGFRQSLQSAIDAAHLA